MEYSNKKKITQILTTTILMACLLIAYFTQTQSYMRLIEYGIILMLLAEIFATFKLVDLEKIIDNKKRTIGMLIAILVSSCFALFYYVLSVVELNTSQLQLIIYALIFLSISIFCGLLIILNGNKKFSCGAFMIILSSGLIYMLMIPVSMVPDEIVHLFTAYHTSNIIMGIDDSAYADNGSILMRESDTTYSYQALGYDDESVFDFISKITEPLGSDELVEYGYSTMRGNEYLYIPCALGITLGRILGLGTVATFLLGRLFSLLFYAGLTAFSIGLLPFGKTLLLIIATLPVSLQQGMSLSYDGFINTSAFFVVSMGIAWCINKDKKTPWYSYVATGILSFALFQCKGHAYAPIALIPWFLLLMKSIKIEENKQKKFILIACLVLFGLIAIVFVTLLLMNNDHLVAEPSAKISYLNADGYTIQHFINHPIDVIYIAYATLRQNRDIYMNEFIGILGWLELSVPQWIIDVEKILILVATIFSGSRALHASKRYIMLIGSLFSILLIFAGMLFAWTPNNSAIVLGVQGRYFTAIVLPLLLSFGGISIKKVKSEYFVIVQCCLVIISIVSVISLYF